MVRYFLRRLALFPLLLLGINFAGFAYAFIAQQAQRAANPYGSNIETAGPIMGQYIEYLHNLYRLDLGLMPVGNVQVMNYLLQAAGASLGLLGIAFIASLLLGLSIGLAAVRVNPPRTSRLLAPLSTLGMALPGFYIGILFVSLTVYLLVFHNIKPMFPMGGFGWDLHLVLPALALTLRPTVQLAQVTATLLSTELLRQYVTTARSIGNSWQRVRWKHAMANILAPVILSIAGSIRAMVAELVLVEWLFGWPGLGRTLALTLVPPRSFSLSGSLDATAFFLNPPLVATILSAFLLFFLIVDLLAGLAARSVDPRQRTTEEGHYD
jgi:peptide/nickel transport system permease protein